MKWKYLSVSNGIVHDKDVTEFVEFKKVEIENFGVIKGRELKCWSSPDS